VPAGDSRKGIVEQVLYASGVGGYHTYRIPALAVTREGTLLAFCEGRRDSRSDSGQIDLLLRRSVDGGETWTAVQVVVSRRGMTCGNPAPVVDAASGAILLPFCQNLADGGEDLICAGLAPRTVWLTRSDDDGATWAGPVDITAAVKPPGWTWYATGPGHGIQLASGRLLVPCDHVVGLRCNRATDPGHAHVILSDDGGATWRLGGIVPEGTNESAAVELAGGTVYINCRNRRGAGSTRATARSTDGGETFGEFARDAALIEPVCQGSLERLEGGRAVVFANPASTVRENLTVRLSIDGCYTWPYACRLTAGPAVYSDLAALPDGAICCLYERGASSPYEEIALARFGLAALTDAAGASVPGSLHGAQRRAPGGPAAETPP